MDVIGAGLVTLYVRDVVGQQLCSSWWSKNGIPSTLVIVSPSMPGDLAMVSHQRLGETSSCPLYSGICLKTVASYFDLSRLILADSQAHQALLD